MPYRSRRRSCKRESSTRATAPRWSSRWQCDQYMTFPSETQPPHPAVVCPLLLSVSPGLSCSALFRRLITAWCLPSSSLPFLVVWSGSPLSSRPVVRSFPRSSQTAPRASLSRSFNLPWWLLVVCYRVLLPCHFSNTVKCWMALLISALPGLFPLTCKGSSAGSLSGISLGGGLLSSVLKCSAHLPLCSSWSVSISPLSARTGLPVLFLTPASVLVMESRSLKSPFPAASSACLARSSTKFLRSFLMFCLTSLLTLEYLVRASAFLALVLLRFNTSFSFFLASIFFRVSALT